VLHVLSDLSKKMKREAEAQAETQVIEIAHSVWCDVLFPAFDARWLMLLRVVNKEWNRTIPSSIRMLSMCNATKHIKDFRPFVSLRMLRVSGGFLTKENFWKYSGQEIFGKLHSLHILAKTNEPFYEKMVKYATNLISLDYDCGDIRYKRIQSYLPAMTNLKHLSICDNFENNSYKCIGDMTQLVTLRLDVFPKNDRTIAPTIDKMLHQLTGLEYLTLNTTYTTYSFLKNMTNLQYLSLIGTRCYDGHGVNDEKCFLVSTPNLPNLRALLFSSNSPLHILDWIFSIKSLSYLCISGSIPQVKNIDIKQSTIGVIHFVPQLIHVESHFTFFLGFVSSLPGGTLLSVRINTGENANIQTNTRGNNYQSIVPKYMKHPENFIPPPIYGASPFSRYLHRVQLQSY
jgi:hypothetical protein